MSVNNIARLVNKNRTDVNSEHRKTIKTVKQNQNKVNSKILHIFSYIYGINLKYFAKESKHFLKNEKGSKCPINISLLWCPKGT